MNATLRLEVCAYFAPEVRAALQAEGIADVELATFCGGCDDRERTPSNIALNPNPLLDSNGSLSGAEAHAGFDSAQPAAMLAEHNKSIALPTLRIGGHCMGGIRPSMQTRKIDSCFDLLLGPTVVARLLTQGVHLLTPRMLHTWRENTATLGLSPADVSSFFTESCTHMVLVDCGVESIAQEELSAYRAFTGVPIEIMSANLDYLRLYLQHIVSTQRLIQERCNAS